MKRLPSLMGGLATIITVVVTHPAIVAGQGGQGQSLADVARETREDRAKRTDKPSKTFTDSDLNQRTTVTDAEAVATTGTKPESSDEKVEPAAVATTNAKSANDAPAGLETDFKDADDAFGTRLAALKKRVDAVLAKDEQADAACSGTTTGSSNGLIYDPLSPVVTIGDVLATTSSVSIDNSTTSECRGLRAAVQSEARAAVTEWEAIEEEARQKGIYPGIVRQLFNKYGLK